MPARRPFSKRQRPGERRSSSARSTVPPDVTNPDKVLWPDAGYTKVDLVRYYQAVAPVLLPHLRDRPLVMKPYPNGIDGRFYFRQTLPSTAPDWLPRWSHDPAGGGATNQMPLASDERALVWLANQAAIEMHPWLSRIDQPRQPDYAVFDLDVSAVEHFPLAREAALLLHEALRERGMAAYAKTTGGDGIHIYVPIGRGPSFDDTRAWALAIAEELCGRRPELLTTDNAIAGRERRVLIDYAQNALGKTTVAPYSVRPRPGAPVSMPVTWDELADDGVTPGDFTIITAPPRIAERGDLFAPVLEGAAKLG